MPAREDWSDGPWQTRNTRWRQTTLEKKTRSRRGQSRKTAVRRSRSTASRWALAGGDGGGDAPEPPPEKRQKLCKPPLWAQCITTPSNFSPQVRPALPPCHRAFSERPCSTRPAAPTRRSILCDISVHKSVKIARKEQRSAYPGPSCTSPAAPWPPPGSSPCYPSQSVASARANARGLLGSIRSAGVRGRGWSVQALAPGFFHRPYSWSDGELRGPASSNLPKSTRVKLGRGRGGGGAGIGDDRAVCGRITLREICQLRSRHRWQAAWALGCLSVSSRGPRTLRRNVRCPNRQAGRLWQPSTCLVQSNRPSTPSLGTSSTSRDPIKMGR